MKRLASLRGAMRAQGMGVLLVTGTANRRYLSGFTGSAGSLLVTEDRAFLITDFRYLEQAAAQAPGWELVRQEGKLADVLRPLLSEQGMRELCFEKDHLTYAQYEALSGIEDCHLRPAGGLVEKLRLAKDEGELEAIARAAALTDAAVAYAWGIMKPGMTEQELALELEYYMRRRAAERAAFDIIVVSGPRTSLPHGHPGPRQIQRGDFVTMDLGCTVDGYCSDLTRTVVVGKADARQREIYRLVLEAQETGLQAIRAGRKGSEVDAEARKVIEEAGYGEHFGHGLGHGVGLEVHEGPVLSPRAAGPDEPELKPGMVVTVEPGVYIPDWGGVRIEDLVVVQEEGARVLSRADKQLLEL